MYQYRNVFNNQANSEHVVELLKSKFPDASRFYNDIGGSNLVRPWVTLVIGSESQSPRKMVSEVRMASLARKSAEEAKRLNADDCLVIEEFVKSLAYQRQALYCDNNNTRAVKLTGFSLNLDSAWDVQLIYVAALLNYAYYFTKLSLWVPKSSRGDEWLYKCRYGLNGEKVNTKIEGTWKKLEKEVEALIKSAEGFKSTEEFKVVYASVICELGRQLLDALTGKQCKRWYESHISPDTVRVFTDFAWLILIEGVKVNAEDEHYLGWAEHRARLCLTARRQGSPVSSIPNLLVNEHAVEAIKTGYEKIDELTKEETGRYSTYAKLLYAQADFACSINRRTADDENGEDKGVRSFVSAPYSVHVVTSFGLELERACLQRENSQPFIVVVPVYIRKETIRKETTSRKGNENHPDKEVYQRWMGYYVNPAETEGGPKGLDKLVTHPHRDNWFIIKSDLFSSVEQFDYDDAELKGYLKEYVIGPYSRGDEVVGAIRAKSVPIIIRLTGSPLIDYPEYTWSRDCAVEEESSKFYKDALGEDAASDPSAVKMSFKLMPALVVEEFDFMESLIPMLEGRGLCEDVFCGNNLFPRYWALLGVDLDDAPTRHRLTAQMLRAFFHEGGQTNASKRGVVINSDFISSEAVAIVQSMRLDFVRDSVSAFDSCAQGYINELNESRENEHGY